MWAWHVRMAPYGRRGSWLVPFAPDGCPGGVPRPLGFVWPSWERGPSSRLCMAACRRGLSPGPRMASVGAWPIPRASYGRRGVVAHPLGPVWQPLGVACPLGLVWPPWGRGLYFGLRMAPWGRGFSSGLVWPEWGRGLSPGPRMATVGAWPVPWAPSAPRRGVACPLGHVWPSWGRGPSPGPRMSAVGGVPRHLCFVWPPWRRGLSPGPRLDSVGTGPSPGPRLAAVGAWLVPWAL